MFTAISETYLILCVDCTNSPITQENAFTNPSPHMLTSPFHSMPSPSQADLFVHVQWRPAAPSWRALSTVLTEPGGQMGMRWEQNQALQLLRMTAIATIGRCFQPPQKPDAAPLVAKRGGG